MSLTTRFLLLVTLFMTTKSWLSDFFDKIQFTLTHLPCTSGILYQLSDTSHFQKRNLLLFNKSAHTSLFIVNFQFFEGKGVDCVCHTFSYYRVFFFSGEFVALDPFVCSPSTISPLYNISHSNQLIPQYTKKRSKKNAQLKKQNVNATVISI